MLRTVITVLALTIAVFLLLPGRSNYLSGPSQEIRHYLELGQVQEAVHLLEKRIQDNPQDLDARRELIRVMAYQPANIARPVLAEEFKGDLATQELDHSWFYTLGRHPEAVVRANVAACIGDAKLTGGERISIRMATDPNKDVRVAATRTLGELGDEAGRFTLLCALKDAEWLVRSTAANSLGQLKPNDLTTRSLFRVLRDDDEYVRFWAQKSLNAQISDKNKATYRGFLREGEPRQRLAAMISLAHFGDTDVLPGLQDSLLTLEGKDLDMAARVLARKAPDRCQEWLASSTLSADKPELAALLKRYLTERNVVDDVLAGGDPGSL